MVVGACSLIVFLQRDALGVVRSLINEVNARFRFECFEECSILLWLFLPLVLLLFVVRFGFVDGCDFAFHRAQTINKL